MRFFVQIKNSFALGGRSSRNLHFCLTNASNFGFIICNYMCFLDDMDSNGNIWKKSWWRKINLFRVCNCFSCLKIRKNIFLAFDLIQQFVTHFFHYFLVAVLQFLVYLRLISLPSRDTCHYRQLKKHKSKYLTKVYTHVINIVTLQNRVT